jgi:hypothetical protein
VCNDVLDIEVPTPCTCPEEIHIRKNARDRDEEIINEVQNFHLDILGQYIVAFEYTITF